MIHSEIQRAFAECITDATSSTLMLSVLRSPAVYISYINAKRSIKPTADVKHRG
jgi:hypothetical protein